MYKVLFNEDEKTGYGYCKDLRIDTGVEKFHFSITYDIEYDEYTIANCNETSYDGIVFDTVRKFKEEFEWYIEFNNIEYYQTDVEIPHMYGTLGQHRKGTYISTVVRLLKGEFDKK